jgi:PiT family inorganic phosphate transporter
MLDTQTLFIFVFISVLLFDFTNGFHDTADMVATSIAAHTIRPSVAIFVVALFTFLGPIIAGVAVADTVGTFVDIKTVDKAVAQSVVIGALFAAISYNISTWYFGLPSSTSNSLAGGLVGAGLMGIGSSHINWGIEALLNGKLDGLMKVISGLFISPIFAFITGFIVLKLFLYLFKRLTIKVEPIFIFSQYFGIAWLGFTHGANDAQKGMAIIGMMLLAIGKTQVFEIPMWVILSCTSAITLGTIFGGWSIIKTLGFKIYKIRLLDSVANMFSAALVNSIATIIGAPTSTTQVVTSSLLGNGAARNPRRTQWNVANKIIKAWIFNIPISMALGSLYTYLLLKVL